eukprot:GHVT01048589.1.p2 GENE.GHVT01048589.1~~GHVT01048589.1.p2  ORF type:complete len:100 (-),score=21.46 GHVT01048589.1:1635-1934(-)
MPVDKATGSHRGFGFVEFVEEEDAQEAIDNVDSAELFGRVLRVNKARSTNLPSHRSAAKQAVWTDDFFHRQKLEEQGMDSDMQEIVDVGPAAEGGDAPE